MGTQENKARSEATFQYTVQNVKKKKGRPLVSPTFYVRNLMWKIVVMPYCTLYRKKHLGVFLQCDGESGNSSWTCNATAHLKLLAQGGRRNGPLIRSIQHVFSSKGNSMGYTDFVQWATAIDPSTGYIKDNAITLEVHVIADAPNGVIADAPNGVIADALNGVVPGATKRPVENSWRDSLRPIKLRKETDGEATNEVRGKTKETCGNSCNDKGMSNCPPKTTDQSNLRNPPLVNEHTDPTSSDCVPPEEPVMTASVLLQTEQQPTVTEPAPGQSLDPQISLPICGPSPLQTTEEIIILTDSDDNEEKDVVPVYNQTRNTAGELQDSEDTKQLGKEAGKGEEEKTDVTKLLIEKADKYFTAQKILFTEKMLRYKLQMELLQKDKMLNNLENEINLMQKEIQEIVQHDKELQQQWQLWYRPSQLAICQTEQ